MYYRKHFLFRTVERFEITVYITTISDRQIDTSRHFDRQTDRGVWMQVPQPSVLLMIRLPLLHQYTPTPTPIIRLHCNLHIHLWRALLQASIMIMSVRLSNNIQHLGLFGLSHSYIVLFMLRQLTKSQYFLSAYCVYYGFCIFRCPICFTLCLYLCALSSLK